MMKKDRTKLGKNQNYLPDEREWRKICFNFSNKQDYSNLNLNGKNDCTVGLKRENQNVTDIDEQMHEILDREREYAEVYAEWAESL